MAGTTDVINAGPTRGAERLEGIQRWSAHPGLARAARLFVYGIPMVLAVASGWLVGRLSFTLTWPALVRWAAMSAVATVVLLVVERAARRLLPLCALLDLSLVFPDRAPSRFAVALRAGSVSQLEARLSSEAEPSTAETADAAAKILAHVMALHAHDRRTRGHSERVRAFAVLIGKELGLDADELDKLQWAALLHDVGKLEVPAAILNKDGKPTKEEWATLTRHPEFGEQLIAPLAAWLGDWVGGVTQHHERWDGDGYPSGLRGENISLAGRIVAVADSFEVMTAARSYKKPLSVAAARAELTRCAGSQYDPAIVRVFLNVSLGRLRRVLSPLAWAGQLPFIPAAVAIPAPGAVAATSALVGGLLLGPAVTPFFGGDTSADASTAQAETTSTTAATVATSARSSTDRTATPDDPSDSSSVTPASPRDRASATPTPTIQPGTPVSDPTTPTTTTPGPVAPGSPALGPVVTPLVDDVVTPTVDGLVTPLVDDVVDPLLDDVVNPLLPGLDLSLGK